MSNRWVHRIPVAIVVGAVFLGAAAVPASAASSLVVTPSSSLVDFQTVTVAGAGFPANDIMGVVQCPVGATTPVSDCDLGTVQLASTDALGAYSIPFVVKRLIDTANGQIDCALTGCEVFSSDLILGNLATAALQFDPNVPALPRLALGITIDPMGTTAGRSRGITVHGTVTCNLASAVQVYGYATQQVGKNVISGFFSATVSCDGVANWSATATADVGSFHEGKVQVGVYAYGTAGPQVTSASAAATVKLREAEQGDH
jgi:hypothetical protein